MKTVALIIFIAVYAAMILLPKRRWIAALLGAAAFLILRILPGFEFLQAIDWNVLLMITGMMITVFYFIESGMTMRIADVLMDRSKNLCILTVVLSIFSGVISAFIDNVATVLMVAPVALAIAKKRNVSPVPMIISIAVSSNLQGAATLVGDTTSIMLGGYANMNFLDFFFMKGRPGIFFAVELGALATIPIMFFLFRKDREPIDADERTFVKDKTPTVFLLLTVLVLILASFDASRPAYTNGIICMFFGILSILNDLIRKRDENTFRLMLKDLDIRTLVLLASLFVVVAGLGRVGIIADISSFFAKIGGENRFLLYSLIVWGSVGISAFIDNIPYVSAMLPVISGMTAMMGIEPELFYFGLLTGATLGGNITPFGASANITGIGLLRKSGYEVKNSEFMRISIPFTLAAVTVGYLFIWFVWR